MIVPGVLAACLPGVYVRGEGPPYFSALPRGLGPGHLCPWQGSSGGVGSPAPPTFPRPPQGLWRWGLRASPTRGSAVPGFPAPQAPGSCGSRPPLPPPPSVPPSLPSLPSAECGRGWEEISPEFPFHTSRLNFLSVSRPLAVCSFSCHRKCQAKVRGCGPAGSAGGSGTGLARSGRGAVGAEGPGAVPRSSPAPLFVYAKLGAGAGPGQGEGEGRGRGPGVRGLGSF